MKLTQIEIFTDQTELNEWLELHSEEYLIKDIKFGYCGTESFVHTKFMVIYETARPARAIPTIPKD